MIDKKGNPLDNKLDKKMNRLFHQKNRSRYSWLYYFFYFGNCLCHPSALIRKKCYEKVGMYDERYASLPDLDFWVRLCFSSNIHILQEELIYMRWFEDHLNESGYSLANLTRCQWEYKNILKNYLGISVDDFNKIFHDRQIENSTLNDQIVDYHLAKLAIATDKTPHKIFAIDLLYEIIQDKDTVMFLAEKEKFTYKELTGISGGTQVSVPGNQYNSVRFLFNQLVNRTLFSLKNRITRLRG